MTGRVSEAHLREWFVPVLVLLSIAAMTGAFVFFNRPESYPPPPADWQTIRPPHIVLALVEQGDIIWAGGPDGLVGLDRHTGEQAAAYSEGVPDVRYVRGLCVDREGALWVAHLSGVTQWVGGVERTFTSDDGLPSGYVASVIEDSAGNIWVGTATGIASYDGLVWKSFAQDEWPGAAPVTVIFEDDDGVLWFGSDSANEAGLTQLDGAAWRSLSNGDGLVHNTVTDIMQARDGAVWISTGLGNRGGVTRIRGEDLISLTMQEGLAGERARALFEDSRGRLWITSEWDGVAVREGAAWRLITPHEGLAGWEVMDIIEDSDGVLWLGTDNGITRVESVDAVFPNL